MQVAGELGLGLEESNASSEGPSRAESLLERIRDSFQPAARRSAAHALAQLLSDDADAQLAVGQFGMPVFFRALALSTSLPVVTRAMRRWSNPHRRGAPRGLRGQRARCGLLKSPLCHRL